MEWEMSELKRERLPAAGGRTGPGALWALVLSGAVTLETADDRLRLLSGDAVLVDRRTAHRLTADVETDLVHADLRPSIPSQLPSPLVVRAFSERQRGVLARVTACPLDVRCTPALFAASYASLIGAAMSALWQGGTARSGLEPEPASATADVQVARVVATLVARPGEPWTVDRMAALVHLSRSALTERFRRATGHSPMRMLRDVRMDRARTLLTDERLPVTRVAFEVGYGSVAAFSRAFAADHGEPPLAWRSVSGRPVEQARPVEQTRPVEQARSPGRGARPWVPSVPPTASGAGYAHERPADPGSHRRDRADHQEQADAVPVQ